jgi:hypothetical protein
MKVHGLVKIILTAGMLLALSLTLYDKGGVGLMG